MLDWPVAAMLDELGCSAEGVAFALIADGVRHTPGTMTKVADAAWRSGGVAIELTAEEAADGSWSVVLEASGVGMVQEVCLLDATLAPRPDSVANYRWFNMFDLQHSTVVLVEREGRGVFACYANPFGEAAVAEHHLRLWYRPGIDASGGTFRSDPLVVGRYEPMGRTAAFRAVPGRDIVAGRVPAYATMVHPDAALELDEGASRAVRAAVAARVPWQPRRTWVSHWDWGENLYRLDPANVEVRETYERLFDVCAAMGADVVLLAPGSSHESAPSKVGPWQHIMWLAMGDAVGSSSWSPGGEPDGVTELLAAATRAGLGVAAYVNPQYPWNDRDDWLIVNEDPMLLGGGHERETGPRRACLANREVADWLTGELIRFCRAYDLAGISLDFVVWEDCWATDHGHEPGQASRYAQWDGYRSIIARTRGTLPDLWIEGLIGAPPLTPWGADDMTNPAAMIGDNQPQWIPAWPDLSVDRTCANFQRRTSYWYRNLGLLPAYKVPSLVGHQANRMHDVDVERGWDWEGARYGLLSAIATGACALTLCFLPCWDEDETSGVIERDAAFFKRWLSFARDNAELLAHTEDLYDEPMPGRVDGTMALGDDGRGLVFLANPDYVAQGARVPVADGFLLRELHPDEGRLWGSDVLVEPHEVAVLEIVPVADVAPPYLVGVAGRVDGDEHLVTASGAPGATVTVELRAADGTARQGRISFASDGVTPTLGPWRDAKSDGVEPVDPGMCAGRVRLITEWVPGRALPALLASLAPPVAPVDHEVLQPWSDPSRLRLFVELMEPLTVDVAAWVDGEPVPVSQAYVGTWSNVCDKDLWPLEHNLLGYYVDLTDRLAAIAGADLERQWSIELELDGLAAGSFGGVHVAHLPRRVIDRFTVEWDSPTGT